MRKRKEKSMLKEMKFEEVRKAEEAKKKRKRAPAGG